AGRRSRDRNPAHSTLFVFICVYLRPISLPPPISLLVRRRQLAGHQVGQQRPDDLGGGGGGLHAARARDDGAGGAGGQGPPRAAPVGRLQDRVVLQNVRVARPQLAQLAAQVVLDFAAVGVGGPLAERRLERQFLLAAADLQLHCLAGLEALHRADEGLGVGRL